MDFFLGTLTGIAWSVLGFLTTLAYLVDLGKKNQQYLIESAIGGTLQVLVAQVAIGICLGIVLWPLFWALAILGLAVSKVKGSAKS